MSAAISVPAFAANGNDLADANLIFNMDNSQSMELAVLSSEEMKSTEGAFWQYGLGALAGMYGSGYGYLAAGGNSPWGFLGAATTGAVGGAWSPINGFRSAAMTFSGTFSTGAIGGYGSNRGWW